MGLAKSFLSLAFNYVAEEDWGFAMRSDPNVVFGEINYFPSRDKERKKTSQGWEDGEPGDAGGKKQVKRRLSSKKNK